MGAKRRRGPLFAAAALLAADAAILSTAARNRSGGPQACLELTARELAMQPRGREDSMLALRLNWRAPGWLEDAAKLRELGVDPAAPRPQSRDVYAILSLSADSPPEQSRLWIEDAGHDAAALRRRYPDGSRHALARAVLRAHPSRRPDARPRASLEIVPPVVYVPPELLPVFDGVEPQATPARGPLYTVRLCYGGLALPWIGGARRTALLDP